MEKSRVRVCAVGNALRGVPQCRVRFLWFRAWVRTLSFRAVGNALCGVPGTDNQFPIANSLPPRIDNLGVRPILPIGDELLAHRILQTVLDYVFNGFREVKHSIKAALLPELAIETEVPRFVRRV